MSTLYDSVSENFLQYLNSTKNYNNNGEGHYAKRLEYIIMNILNIRYDYKLTPPRQSNFSGIDLYDKDNEIAVQVKSNRLDTAKLKVAKKIIEENSKVEFNNLNEVIFFAGEGFTSKNKITNEKYSYYDTDDILALFKELPVIRLESINKLFTDYTNLFSSGCYKFEEKQNDPVFFPFIKSKIKLFEQFGDIDIYIKKINRENILYLRADPGRGKTTICYLIAKYFLEKNYDVIYIDCLHWDYKIDKLSSLNNYIFTKTFIVVDNVHLNEGIIDAIDSSLNKENIKILYSARFYSNVAFDNFIPNRDDVLQIIESNFSGFKTQIKKSIIQFVGNDNSNLRLLDIILNLYYDNSKLEFSKIFKNYSGKFNSEIIKLPISRSKKEKSIKILIELAKNSISEIVYQQDNNKLFEKMYDLGLLNKRSEEYSFIHIQDAICYLIGVGQSDYIFDKLNEMFNDIKANNYQNKISEFTNLTRFLSSLKDLNNDDITNKIKAVYINWHQWIMEDTENANKFLISDSMLLYNYYLNGCNLNVINPEIIKNHFCNLLIKHREDIINFDLLILELLMVFSNTKYERDDKALIQYINFSENEIENLLKRMKSKSGFTRLTSFINSSFNGKYKNDQNQNKKIHNYRLIDVSRYLNNRINNSIENEDLINDSKINAEIKKTFNNIDQIVIHNNINQISRFVYPLKQINYDKSIEFMNNKTIKDYIINQYLEDLTLEKLKYFIRLYDENIDYIEDLLKKIMARENKDLIDEFLEHQENYRIDNDKEEKPLAELKILYLHNKLTYAS